MKGNHSNIYGPLDLWPGDRKITRDYLLVMKNQYVKYEDFVIKNNQDNERKSY
jgi:hypothetical protein